MNPLFAKPIVFPIIDSTNRYLADEARAGAPEGVVVIADEQSAGRGRRGRSWIVESGSSLLCSMLFRPVLHLRDVHLVPTIVGLGAHRCIRELTGVEPEFKWPNDLLVAEKKVAGLLSEVVINDDGYALVVGIGINIRWPTGSPSAPDSEELADLEERATALELVAQRSIDRDELLRLLLSHIEADYLTLDEPDNHDRVMDRYRAACSTIGRRVRVDTVDATFEAEAVRVTDAGHLVVSVDDDVRELDAGDVVHLRTIAT